VIFEAVAAIKIANEAIGAIKEFAGHVESVGQMGKDLTKLADAKEELEKSAKDGDMDAFWALEDIKKHEAEVKNMFIYNGRPGLWDDYCKFVENRKQMRQNAKKREAQKKARRKRAIKDAMIVTAGLIGGATLIGVAGLILYWLIQAKGR